MKTYIVQSGDWLSKIADRLGVSEEHLINVNNIVDANKIYPGQKLSYTPAGVTMGPPAPRSSGVAVPPTALPTSNFSLKLKSLTANKPLFYGSIAAVSAAILAAFYLPKKSV